MAARVVVPDLADPQTAYAAIALRLLPPGIMGLMMAAMFAATMSAVDSELNVTAGVFVRDVYERHLRPAASPGELMWVARVATLVVGGLIVAGAMFVSQIGGAFEANKLLTALVGIPLAIPLVFGIVLRFKYKMHASSLPSDFSPLREEMMLAGQAFTVKGGPDITTDGAATWWSAVFGRR